ncbi:MAG: hydantoinase B/oxoprolinase family protein, partial [Nitrospinota bacterium]
MAYDPIKLEVFKNLYFAIAEEMGVALCRTSFSPNIKERHDFSCAIFDGKGKMVAQAAHMPAHLGSMPLSVTSAIEHVPMERGDMVVLNDPFLGGTHLPDITLVYPVFIGRDRTPTFYLANRAHHADVGGAHPGSMSLSTEIFQEGIRIPPVKLMRKGKLCEEAMALILDNVRTSEEREGDITAQVAANRVGERRLKALVAKHGLTTIRLYMRELQRYAERMTREAIRRIPDGEYCFEDFMDDDGVSPEPVLIRVKITVRGDEAVVDFSGSSPQVRGSVNAVEAVALSSVFYAFRCIVQWDIPSNSGCMEPIRLVAPPGTVVNALPPAAVAGGNVETSQRMVDVLFGALAKGIPDLIPAASSGTMNNLTVGGLDPRPGPTHGHPFAYYETIGGGMGGRPWAPGIDAIHTHMTNTMNTPIEALEHEYPMRVRRYQIRRGSGGKGLFRGGDGIIREVEVLGEATVSLLSERRRFSPYGLQGGEPGQPGRNFLLSGDEKRPLPSKFALGVKGGDVLSIHTP